MFATSDAFSKCSWTLHPKYVGINEEMWWLKANVDADVFGAEL